MPVVRSHVNADYGNAIFWIQASRKRLGRSPTPDDDAVEWNRQHDRAIAARRERLVELAKLVQEQLATQHD